MFEALVDLLVYSGMRLDPASHTGAALHFFVMLVLIVYATGLLWAFL